MEEITGVVNGTPTAQPVPPDLRATDMNLKLKKNVTYIVAGVVIQDGKVLMIQENKISCRNKWYLPAGRMEREESIVEAVKREVLEESGMMFEPEALIAVENQSHLWVRFTLTGRITGGSLKTKEQADKESIQGGWFSADTKRLCQEVKLRAPDIIPLIELAAEWYKHRPYTGLPVTVGHTSSSKRLLIVHDDGLEVRVLVAKDEGSTRLPVCLFSAQRFFSSAENTMDSTVKACGYHGRYKECGILSMEHTGKPSGTFDGFCITLVLVAATMELTPGSKGKGQPREYEWIVVSDPACVDRLRVAISGDVRGCASFIHL